jgi:predicted RNase H-like HicB family nuclease
MTYFVGILEGAGKSWGVRFPDLDGCVGAGTTPEAAVSDAAQALRDVIAYKRHGAFALPVARTLDAILASGDVGRGETTVLVPLLLDSGRSVRANVTFDAGLLDAIDRAAKARGVTRSAFLASAAREKIEALG